MELTGRNVKSSEREGQRVKSKGKEDSRGQQPSYIETTEQEVKKGESPKARDRIV